MNTYARNLQRVFIFSIVLLIVCFSLTLNARAQTSEIDSSFKPLPSKDVEGGNFAIQPDGKILAFGSFHVVNEQLKNRIVRLNTDGSLDNSFNCDSCDFNINSALVQPDGKIVVAGATVSDYSSAVVSRLNNR